MGNGAQPLQSDDRESGPCLRVAELAERWNVNHKTLRDQLAKGAIPAMRLGRKILIPRKGIEALEARGSIADR